MTNGVIRGGGSDPTTEAAFSAFPVVDAFKTSACRKLKFRPKLATKVLGGRKATRRAQNPKFRAILTAAARATPTSARRRSPCPRR